MSTTLSFIIENDPDQLEVLFSKIEELGESENWSLALTSRINLVLEEASLNVIKYGHNDGNTHLIEFTVISEPDSVTIDMSDDGHPFDPLTDGPPVDTTSPVGERAIGGLGIHFVRTLMDTVSYQRVDGKNQLTMIARRAE